MPIERLYTVEEIAELLDVHGQTVRRWLRDGELEGMLISRRAGYRVSQSEVERFIREGKRESEKRLAA